MSNNFKLQTRAMLRAAPPIVLLASILVFLITNQLTPLRFAGYFIITELVAALLKKLSGTLSKHPGLYRPKGAGHCTGCGPFARCAEGCINIDNRVGMPSGHAMTIMMTATFWSLWIWRQGSGNVWSKAVRIGFLFILALMVTISRTVLLENCHTYLQITVGAVLGIASGIGFYAVEMCGVSPYFNKNRSKRMR
jgi:membrane-associated phospholipid phosphatase